jgi:hypothetical protein
VPFDIVVFGGPVAVIGAIWLFNILNALQNQFIPWVADPPSGQPSRVCLPRRLVWSLFPSLPDGCG